MHTYITVHTHTSSEAAACSIPAMLRCRQSAPPARWRRLSLALRVLADVGRGRRGSSVLSERRPTRREESDEADGGTARRKEGDEDKAGKEQDKEDEEHGKQASKSQGNSR